MLVVAQTSLKQDVFEEFFKMTGASDNVESYVKNILPVKIVENNEEFKDCKVIECKATNSKSLDGFASTIFQIHLVLEDKKSGM